MRDRSERKLRVEQLEDRRLLVAGLGEWNLRESAGLDAEEVITQQQWQNPADPYDVNGDGSVAPIDVLLGINQLNSGETDLETLIAEGQLSARWRYVDVSGDGHLSPIDSLQIINYLNLPEETAPPDATTIHFDAAAPGQAIRVIRQGEQIAVRLMDAVDGGSAIRRLVAPTQQIDRVVLNEPDGAATVLSLDQGRVRSRERWTVEGGYTQQEFDDSGLRLHRTALNGVLLQLDEWRANGDYVRTHLDSSGMIIRSTFVDGRIRAVEQFSVNISDANRITLGELSDVSFHQVARSMILPITTTGNVVDLQATAFLADPRFELRYQLGLGPVDASHDNRLGLGEKWLTAVGNRYYLLLPDGRLVRQAESASQAESPANLVAQLTSDVYADPQQLWLAGGLPVAALARVTSTDVTIEIPAAQSGAFTVGITVTGEGSSTTRFFDVSVDNAAYLTSYNALQADLNSLRTGDLSPAAILTRLKELEATVDPEFLTDLSAIRQEVEQENQRLQNAISDQESEYATVSGSAQSQLDKLAAHQQLLTEAIAEYQSLWNARARAPAYVRSQLVADGALTGSSSGTRSFVSQRSQSSSNGLTATHNTLLVYGDFLFTIDANAKLNRYTIQSGDKRVMSGIGSRALSVVGKQGTGNVYVLAETGRVYQLTGDDTWRATGNDTTPAFRDLFTQSGHPFAIRERVTFEPGRAGPVRTVHEDRYWLNTSTNEWTLEAACPPRVFCPPPVPDVVDVNSLSGLKTISLDQLNAVTERVRTVAQVILADSEETAAAELRGLLETLESGVKGYAAELQTAATTYAQQVASISAVRNDRIATATATKDSLVSGYNSKESQEVAAEESKKTTAQTKYNAGVTDAENSYQTSVDKQQQAKTRAANERDSANTAAQQEHDRRAAGDVGGFGLFQKPQWVQDAQDTADAVCGNVCDEAERWAESARTWLRGRLDAIESTYHQAIASANKEIQRLGNWLETQKTNLLKKRDDLVKAANEKIASAKEYYQEKRESAETTWSEQKTHWNNWYEERREVAEKARDQAVESAIVTVFDDGFSHLGKISADLNVNLQGLDVDLGKLNLEHLGSLGNLNAGALASIDTSLSFSPPAALQSVDIPLNAAILNSGSPLNNLSFEQLTTEALVATTLGVAPIWVVSLLSPELREIVDAVGGEVGSWDNKLAEWWHSLFAPEVTDHRTRTNVPDSPDEPAGPTPDPVEGTRRTVTIQPIIVSDSDGDNTATFLGSSSQRAKIQKLVDEIYEDADIQFDWLDANEWNNTFANQGNDGEETRDSDDLDLVRQRGDDAEVGNTDFLVVDMYFVKKVPGHEPPSSESSVMGIGGRSIRTTNGALDPTSTSGKAMVFIGSDLLDTSSGRESIARLLGHELGHVLGLAHECLPKNLMYTRADGDDDGIADICADDPTKGSQGNRLTETQRDEVNKSVFVRPPEDE